MKENRCPNCDLLNLASATVCLQCKTSLTGEPSPPTDANIPTPTAEYSQTGYAPPMPSGHRTTPTFDSPADSMVPDNKTGQRTHFWYRLFCSAVVVTGILLSIFGLLAIIGSFDMKEPDATEAFEFSIFLLFIGAPPALLYFLGVVLPSKPFHWFYGLFLLGLAILSCGPAIFAIPLLIFWVKPETQAYFERK